MKACIPANLLDEAIQILAGEVPINVEAEKATRVRIWDISGTDVKNMVTGLSSTDLENQGKVPSEAVTSKLTNNLNSAKQNKDFVNSVMSKIFSDSNDAENRHQAMGLKLILDTVKGELDKAVKHDVPLKNIENGNGIPFIPTHRLAATLGRQILYTNGMRIQKGNLKGENKSAHVEHMYYQAGIKALEQLENKGFISLHDKGKNSIRDYLKESEKYIDNKNIVTQSVSVIELHSEPLGSKETGNQSTDPVLTEIRGMPGESKPKFISKSPYNSFKSALEAIDLVSTPRHISFPHSKPEDVQSAHGDDYEVIGTTEKVRKEIQKRPLKFNSSMFDLFKLIKEESKNSEQSGSKRIKRLMTDDVLSEKLFKIEKTAEVASDRASALGRKLAATTPLDDLIEYFDRIPENMFIAMFAGRNTRLYIDNSIVNYHSSKLMRHSLVIEEYSMSTGNPDFDWTVDKMVANLKLEGFTDKDVKSAIYDNNKNSTNPVTKKLNKALSSFNKFNDSDTAYDKLEQAKEMFKSFQADDIGAMITTLQGISDARKALESGTFTSSFVASSDATASGGQLTLMQALGGNKKAISNLLKRLGIFKGESKKPRLNDLYGILQERIEKNINDFKEEFDISDMAENKENILEIEKEPLWVMNTINEILFKGNQRDLAKSPTMTFIYGQSRDGAVKSLAEEFTGKVIELYKTPKQRKQIDKLLKSIGVEGENYSDIVKDNIDFKQDLKEKFIDSKVPDTLYNYLDSAITVPFLDHYKNQAKKVFEFVESVDVNRIKVFPAPLVMDIANGKSDITRTKENLDKYGVPITKVMEKAHVINGDTVLTREEILRNTIMNVSLIHSADTANLMMSLDGLVEKYDRGVMIIHDDVRGHPSMVREAEQQFIDAFKDIALNYSVHKEVMESIAVYDQSTNSKEKLTDNKSYIKLLSQINSELEAKKEILEDKDNGFDNKTTSLIGDKPIDSDGNSINKQPSNEQTLVDTEQNTQVSKPTSVSNGVNKKLKKAKVELLVMAGEDSKIVKGFLALRNRAKIVNAGSSSFDTEKDKIKINLSGLSVKSVLNGKAKGSDEYSKVVKELEHEIVHSYTTAVIQDHYSNGENNQDIKYIEKSINSLGEKDLNKFNLPDEVKSRISYINNQADTKGKVAEFISIMNTEPLIAGAIYPVFGESKTSLKNIIKRVLGKVYEVIKRATAEDNLHDKVNAEQLYSSLNAVMQDGKSLRENEYDTFTKLQKDFGRNLNYDTNNKAPEGLLPKAAHAIDAVNQSVAKYTTQYALEKSFVGTKGLDKWLTTILPSYTVVKNRAKGIYDDSKTLKSVMHKITNSGINKIKKNEILSLFQKIFDDKESITSKELERFKKASKSVSKEDLKSFNDFNNKMSMTDYFVMYPEGITDVDSEIKSLLNKKIFSNKELKSLDKLVEFNISGEYRTGTPYNLLNTDLGKGEQKNNARKLLLLKSIKAIGEGRFNSFLKNKELVEVNRDNLLANAAIISSSTVIKTDKLKDNGLVHKLKEPVFFKAISENQLKFYDENNDWVVLRKPEKNKPGVVYQKVIDSNYQSSVFTTIQLNSGEVEFGSNVQQFKNQDTVVQLGNEYKIVLTNEEKEAVGVIENAAQSIVRTMAHNLAIQDSEIIRQKLLEEDTFFDMSNRGESLLNKIINDKERENPWFVGDIDDKNFSNLSAEIKANYIRVPSNISSIGNFNKKVKYVRKDISYWLVGSAEQSVANNRTLQKAIKVTKDLISSTKIGMVILNPVKIAKDNVFNFIYLATLGVDVGKIGVSYKKISEEFHDYQQLKDRYQSLKVKAIANPKSNYEKELARYSDLLENHGMAGVVKRGFINSLGSEIIMQNDSPGGGFKDDIDKALKTVLQNNEGKDNALGKLILRAANTPGISMEGMLEMWSRPFKVLNSTKAIEKEMLRMSDRVKNIKSDEDVIAYMHQYLNSPDSEFVKLGTYMTDLTDVLAKETYFRHLVDGKGMSPESAEKAVLTAFPDYKEGLPTAVQKLDSVGILMFPQYWMQMIRAMYRLAEKRPVSFGSEMMLAEMMDTKSQLWSQTIFDKAFSSWGLVHNPVNHIGVGSILPTEVF